jgi:uncharacterized repeat protein (TIGR01451 family)
VAIGLNCTVTFDIIVNTPLNNGTIVSNTSTISAADEGGTGATLNSTNLSVITTPNLSVTKIDNDADNTITPGQSIIYTVTISNNGNGLATGVTLADTPTGNISGINSFVLTNCGGSYSNNSTSTDIDIQDVEIAVGVDCVISYTVIAGTPDTEGANITNVADISQASEGGNDPTAVSADALTFDSNDGIDVPTESSSPNGGDANDDGTDDSIQPDVTSFLNPVTNQYNSNNCVNRNVSQVSQSNIVARDGSYDYPVGLMNFELNCGVNGITATVTQYYYGSVPAGELVARKYTTNLSQYTTIPNAIVTRETVSGVSVIKMVYQITDGSEFDDDGIVNGIIIDPAGPAILGQTLTQTGKTILSDLISAFFIISTVITLGFINIRNETPEVHSDTV